MPMYNWEVSLWTTGLDDEILNVTETVRRDCMDYGYEPNSLHRNIIRGGLEDGYIQVVWTTDVALPFGSESQ